MEIYIHIPFCVKKCQYCDFLSFPADAETKKEYMKHLLREMLLFSEKKEVKGKKVTSVFIGGGTPNSVDPQYIAQIMDLLHRHYTLIEDCEITMESNPGLLTEEKLRIYHQSGINRLSIGLQSADNRELKLLGRIHTWEEFQQSYLMARAAGFTNINIDLITSLPYQKKESVEETLHKVLTLHPEHISAYSLIIEPGTPFYEKYEEDVLRREAGKETLILPDEDEEYQTGKLTARILSENGYEHYEISNYASSGYSCRHNIGYWQGEEYLGFGLGASGYINGLRYRNTPDMPIYIEGIRSGKPELEESHLLTEQERMEEFMFLGLRMLKGVSAAEFKKRFGKDIDDIYGEKISALKEEGLLAQTGEQIYLTERGMDLANYVMAEFLM